MLILFTHSFVLLDVSINAYPYATDFIAERFDNGECDVNGSPIGIIGSCEYTTDSTAEAF